ncbi:unnamed protein product [Coregonus sp. 'balchen']|nr:unnamed protein product [Coregonus sp. 'balchen']
MMGSAESVPVEKARTVLSQLVPTPLGGKERNMDRGKDVVSQLHHCSCNQSRNQWEELKGRDARELALAQRKFAHSLGEFQFEYIGDAKTDDERNITETLMKPLEKFRKEQLGSAKEERKKYEKETEKYYSSLEKLLNMSAKKKEPQLQETRSRFEGTRVEVFELMKRIREVPQEYRQTSPISSEGYLYVQEKRPPPFGSSWVKRYCTFVKEQKILHMVTFDHRSGGKIGETESVTLKSCVRKTTDMLDRRFCLDIEITDRPGTVLTVQSLSEDDHKFWIHAMGGKEPVGQYLGKTHLKERGIDAQLDDVGLSFVKNAINAIETRDEKSNDVDLSTCEDWDVKTVTSTLKLYMRSLPEPLMTYGLYKDFIAPAKGGSPESRSQAIHCLVHKLPEKNRLVLGLLMKHLATVAAHSKLNLMTVANLGVVFGPTLMRPQEDTVAAIMDLKFQNIVVEILIEQHEKIFGDVPDASSPGLSAPTRQSKKLSVRQNRPLAVYNPKSVDLQTGKRQNDPWPSITHSKRQNRPLAVYNPQSVDLQTVSPDVGSNSDEASLGSNESVSSQSSGATASETPPEKANHAPLLASLSSGDSPGGTEGLHTTPPVISDVESLSSQPRKRSSRKACIAVAASWLNSGALTKVGSDGDKTEDGVTGGGGKKAMAVYPCEAEHDSELSFQVGAIFSAVAPSREPGWLEGELEGKRGLIPENYVEML